MRPSTALRNNKVLPRCVSSSLCPLSVQASFFPSIGDLGSTPLPCALAPISAADEGAGDIPCAFFDSSIAALALGLS